MVVDHNQNETYLKLLDSLGPMQSLILIDKLMIDLKDTMRGLKAAQSVKSKNMLLEPSHVLISLAGVVGVTELHQIAQEVNRKVTMDKAYYPSELVQNAIADIDLWLIFLKADKIARDKAS